MSEFKVTDKVRVEEVGVVIKVINSTKEKTSYLNNRKSSLRTKPHYLRPQVLANMYSLKGRTEMKLEIKELKNSYLAREMVSQVQLPRTEA